MQFGETPVFTKEIRAALPDDQYKTLQTALSLRPEQGAIIPGSAGLRKLGWGGKGHGKSGGLRFIYYWDKKTETIYLLYVYPKNRQEDLTTEQRKLLSRLVREEFK
jgi:mRNA-degrading endonuclease RelE of RelBE toxin-antitoxin system